MALATRAKFYFGHEVLADGTYFDFAEGGPTLSAQVDPGYYSAEEFVLEVQRALNDAGALVYAVDFNRTTRLVTISASGTFSILGTTGPHTGSSLYTLLGYNGVNLTGANSYTFTAVSGLEYIPQFFLLDYVDPEMRQESVDSNISVTGSGKVEVVRFSIQKFYEFTIDFINDQCRSNDVSLIESNLNGKSDAIQFLQEVTKKGHIEIMPDRDNVDDFYTIILESTPASIAGTGYRLVEKTAQGLIGYFSTCLLYTSPSPRDRG